MDEISLFNREWERLERTLSILKIPYETEFSSYTDANDEVSTIYVKHIKIAPCKINIGKLREE